MITQEWAENNYHHVLIQNQLADLVKINAFWRDYAAYLADGAQGPFLSENVAEPTSNFSEMMLALAVALGAAPSMGQERFAWVNVDYVVANSTAFKTVQEQMNATRQMAQDSVQARNAAFSASL